MKIKNSKVSVFKLNAIFIMLFVTSSLFAQNLITNGDFESWGTLGSTDGSGLKPSVPTGWTAAAGSGSLVTYQSPVTASGTGSSIFLCNVSTGVSRFFSPNTSTLAAGSYKLSFKSRGSVTWGSITLTQSTVTLNAAVATTPAANNLFPNSGQVTTLVPDGSTTWTTNEYIFNVTVSGLYRIIFWPTKTKGANSASAADFLLIDDVSLSPNVDNTISTLSELRVKGSLVDNFSSSNLNYTLTLPKTVTIPALTGVATDNRCVVVTSNATNLSGTEAERTATVTVTAADGITQKLYKIIYTMTTDLILEGFASTELPPSLYTFSTAGADWRIDGVLGNNNGLIWGANSLRANGGTISAANFTINNIANSGTLSFYLKKRDTDAAGKLTVSYQYTTDPVGQWTELANYTTFPATYEKQSFVLNKNAAVNFKFDVVKTSGLSPFNLDDLMLTLKPIDAPTNLIATPGNGQASVAFTAPSNNVGSAIIDYTITSNPEGKTATASSSPINVIGLTNGISYTFTATVRNGNGSSVASTASNSVIPIAGTIAGTSNTTTLGLSNSSDIIIAKDAQLNVDANTTVNSVTVEAGGRLNLANPLIVTDVVLKADESGSFSANIGAVSTVNGTVKYERTMLDTNWYFMSFPCNVNVAEISGGGTIDVDWFIQEYNGAHRATAGAGGNWSHVTSGTLTAKKGYIFGLKSGAGTKILSFPLDKALIQSEALSTVPATFYDGSVGTNHKGWNLIGQPYLSKFAGTNVGLNYLTTWTGSAYDGKVNTAVASINPFEAFFVQVADNNPISFAIEGRQNVRSLIDADFSDRVQLSFTSVTGSDNTNLIMDNDQSTAYEINKDLEKWITIGTDKPQLYTQLEGISYAYNALPMNAVINLPVGFYTKTAGSTTISVNASQAPSLSKLFLTDNNTSPAIVTDLLTSDYTFNATGGTDNVRFVITAQRISTETIQGNELGVPEISLSNGKLKITNITINDRIRVFNSVGQLVFNNIANKSTIEIPLPKVGMYIIQIESETRSRTIKIVNPKQL